MKSIHIKRRQLRNYLIHWHLLHKKAASIQDVFNRLLSIQYDPLHIVSRNADLVLQSRIKDFSSLTLYNALYKERFLIDGWDKMMSIFRAVDWPLFTRMRSRRELIARYWLGSLNSAEVMPHIDDLLKVVKERGPLQAGAIESKKLISGSWGHKKIAGAGLDYLFHAGKVGVYGKKANQKIYAAIENLLPADILSLDDPFTSDMEFDSWLVKRRVNSMGLIWNKNSAVWQELGCDLHKAAYRKRLFDQLVANEQLVPLTCDGISTYLYMAPEQVDILHKFDSENHEYPDTAMSFLAPLDNFMWDRNLIEAVFDFSYRWEVYTPKAKRTYGYYVLPILYKDTLVGRFEPVFDKKKSRFDVLNVWWEETPSREVEKAYKAALEEFEAFLKFSGDADD